MSSSEIAINLKCSKHSFLSITIVTLSFAWHGSSRSSLKARWVQISKHQLWLQIFFEIFWKQELRVRSRINPYSFQPLPVYQVTVIKTNRWCVYQPVSANLINNMFSFQCDKTSIAKALNSPLPFNDPLDGLLIYHRRVKSILLILFIADKPV